MKLKRGVKSGAPVIIDDDGSGGLEGKRSRNQTFRLFLFIPLTVSATPLKQGQPITFSGSIDTVTVTFKGPGAPSTSVSLSNVFRCSILAAGLNNSAPKGITILSQNGQVTITPDDQLQDDGQFNNSEKYEDPNTGNFVSAVFESRSANGQVEMHHYMPGGGGQISFTINIV